MRPPVPRQPYVFSGPRLRGLRERAGLRRHELARLISRSAASIQKYEERGGVPSLHVLCDLATALAVTPNDLFRRYDDDGDERLDAQRAPATRLQVIPGQAGGPPQR